MRTDLTDKRPTEVALEKENQGCYREETELHKYTKRETAEIIDEISTIVTIQ